MTILDTDSIKDIYESCLNISDISYDEHNIKLTNINELYESGINAYLVFKNSKKTVSDIYSYKESSFNTGSTNSESTLRYIEKIETGIEKINRIIDKVVIFKENQNKKNIFNTKKTLDNIIQLKINSHKDIGFRLDLHNITEYECLIIGNEWLMSQIFIDILEIFIKVIKTNNNKKLINAAVKKRKDQYVIFFNSYNFNIPLLSNSSSIDEDNSNTDIQTTLSLNLIKNTITKWKGSFETLTEKDYGTSYILSFPKIL